MPAVITVLIIAVVLIGVVLYMRSRGGAAWPAAGKATAEPAMREVDFKVEGRTAHVYFDTHIPAGGADSVLRNIMSREAMRVFHSKSGHLPLQEVRHVVVHGHQGDDSVEVVRVDVKRPPSPDHLDEPDVPPLASEVPSHGEDLLGTVHAMDFGRGGGYRGGSGDDLPPLSKELKIPAKIIEAVAGAGGSIAGMSLREFISGVLRLSGYEVEVADDGTGTARKGGVTTFVQFVDHAPGAYPELSESAVDGFVRKFMAHHADRGMLFTPKYSPYAIYERERRNDRIRFITRERLQGFVDSVAME